MFDLTRSVELDLYSSCSPKECEARARVSLSKGLKTRSGQDTTNSRKTPRRNQSVNWRFLKEESPNLERKTEEVTEEPSGRLL